MPVSVICALLVLGLIAACFVLYFRHEEQQEQISKNLLTYHREPTLNDQYLDTLQSQDDPQKVCL